MTGSRRLRQRRDGGARYEQHDDRDGDVDPERPPPGEVVGEEAAQQRADHGGDAEHGTERALVATAVAQRDDFADDGHGRHHDRAAADALQRPRRDQHGHRTAQTAKHRADEEEDHRRLEHRLAAEQVTELSDDRRDDGRRQQIACDDPGLVARTAEVGDDRRQRGGHDGLVERGQQHAEQHRDEDEVAALRADACATRLWVRDGGRRSLTGHTCLPLVTTVPKAISLDRL